MSKWEKVGTIGVDAGLCWVGDPCYILKDEGETRYSQLGKDWSEFCDKINSDGVTTFDELGVAVQTGYGDGVYPVYVRRDFDGRVVGVKVKFD